MNNWTCKYRYTILNRVWAILLLAIFINATLIESLHNHGFEGISISKQKVNTITHQKQLTTSILKCKLCDIIKHHSHFYSLPTQYHPGFYLTKPPEEKSTIFILAKSSAFVLLSSNKGPPSIKA